MNIWLKASPHVLHGEGRNLGGVWRHRRLIFGRAVWYFD